MSLVLDTLRWRLGVIAVALLFVPALPGALSADELSNVFDRLLTNPDDPALNIRYAELVEARGDIRKALAAYERALARDPANPDLKRAYRRVKRRLQPSVTSLTWENGVAWESNPLQLPDGAARRESDLTIDSRFYLFDERTLARHRWRSLGEFGTQYQGDIDDLNDAAVSFSSGPIFDLGLKSRLHVVPGAGMAWLDSDWLYHDVFVRLTLETVMGGATQSVAALIAHRHTNSAFRGSDGLLAQVTAKLANYNKIMPGDAFYVLPRFRYSEPSGSGPGRVFNRSLFPGDFVEAGNRVVYYLPIAGGQAFLGGGFGAYRRVYDQNVAFGTTDRKDWLLEPTAHLNIRKVLDTKFDLSIDYRFEHNDSNDATENFDNHVVGVRTVRRF